MDLNDITVIDFETSGLDPQQERIIEIAAIRCQGDQIVSQFSTLVRYDSELKPRITEITGITKADLAHGMDEDTAMRILNRMLGSNTIVAHNAAFDLGFLHYTLMRVAGRSFTNNFLDTLTICRERHTYPHTLKDMCNRYGIALDQGHRALYDVLATWEVLKALHREQPVDPYLNKLGYLRKFGRPRWTPPHALLETVDIQYAQ